MNITSTKKQSIYLVIQQTLNILQNPLNNCKMEIQLKQMSKLNILFTHHAVADYQYWQEQDKKMLKRVNELINSIQRDGALEGIGEPEKLKGNLSGFYSRRIDTEHRLVYKVSEQQLSIIACRYHY